MSKVIITLIIATLTTTTFCQESERSKSSFTNKNSLQVELFGHGLYYSVYYERVILNGLKFKTSGQIGFSYYPPSTGVRDIWLPILVNELISFSKHHIELGIGHIFINEAVRGIDNKVESRRWDGFITARLGYRYQKPDGHLILRIGFTPIIEYTETYEFHPSAGLALGYSF